jgi:isocitrate/isopropylmalate dehydrogenase
MLAWLDHVNKAQLIENAVRDVIKKEESLTPDLGGNSKTSDVGKSIQDQIYLYIKEGLD